MPATDLLTTIRPLCTCCTVTNHLSTFMLTPSSLLQKRPRQESTPNSQSTSRNIEAGKAKGRRDHNHDRRVPQTGTLSLSVSSFWACNLYLSMNNQDLAVNRRSTRLAATASYRWSESTARKARMGPDRTGDYDGLAHQTYSTWSAFTVHALSSTPLRLASNATRQCTSYLLPCLVSCGRSKYLRAACVR